MNQPLVSIITVTYNSGEYVRDTINSIVDSSYQNFELIIGDDASYDDTWNIISEFKDDRIRKYRNESNVGEYPNRNKAIDLARGKYLIFIDGDDMIYPHGLEFMVSHFELYEDCGMAIMYPFVNWIYLPVIITPIEFYQSNYFNKGFNDVAFANTFFRTDVLKNVGGLPEQYMAGDTYVRLKIASRYNTLIIQDQLTWWRETPGQAFQRMSISANVFNENLNLHLKVLSDKDCPLTKHEVERAKGNQYFQLRLGLYYFLKKMRLLSFMINVKTLIVKGDFLKVFLAKRYRKTVFNNSPVNPLRTMRLQSIELNPGRE